MTYITSTLGILGGQEIILIVLIILLIFGGRKIPELMKGIGKGIKEFKNANINEDEEKDGTPTNSDKS